MMTMTATFFKTDANEVTPLGIWLATRLNKAVYALSFKRLKTVDQMRSYYGYRIHSLELAFETKGQSFLGSPTHLCEPNVKAELDDYSQAVKYQYELRPLRGGVAIHLMDHKRSNTEPYLKELLVRQAAESWKREGEMQMRKFLESFEVDKQIYQVSKHRKF